MPKESRLWSWLDTHREAWLAIERLEPMYPPGLPDCFWHDKREGGGTGWLELKRCEANDPEWARGRIPKLRTTQPLFLNRWARDGVPSGLLLQAGDEMWLWKAPGEHEWANTMRSSDARSTGCVRVDVVGGRVLKPAQIIALLFDIMSGSWTPHEKAEL